MEVIDNLLLINDTSSLDAYLDENIQKIFDELFLSDYDEIKLYSGKINSYYVNNYRVIYNLDFAQNYNSAFVLMLADFLERFDCSASFISIIGLCNSKGISISSRLQASHLVLKKKNFHQEYIDIYDDVLLLLDTAYKNEEDDVTMITYSFSNYFHKVINDTHTYDSAIAIKLQDNLIQSKSEKLYFFLENSIIDYLININIPSYSLKESEHLQNLISTCIKKKKVVIKKDTTISFIVEEDTLYSENLKSTAKNFKSIRSLSIKYSNYIENDDIVRQSLGRGVSVLTYEEQLFLYLRDFGNMHKAKLDSAFESLANRFDGKTIDIIDWGCGQALASIALFDFLSDHQDLIDISQVILIEPSELCLKRGALHVVKYDTCNNIRTVNKEFNSLLPLDLKTNDSNIKIHLFSNILDVEKFSIDNLVSLISSTQKGENYFVCVSPYIDVQKATRLERFYNLFNSRFNSTLLSNRSNSKQGDYWNCNHKYNNNCECVNHPFCTPYDSRKHRWTRYEKVFNVVI